MKKKLEIYIILLVSIFQLIWPLTTSALTEPVSTESDKIVLSKNKKLYMPSEIDPTCAKNHENYCFPNTKLFLIHKKIRYDFSKIISQWEGSFYIYFIKISPEKYFDDLDRDGHPEIAIFPMVAGNSPSAPALIVTVKNDQIVHFGAGLFYWENGKHVIEIKKGKKWK